MPEQLPYTDSVNIVNTGYGDCSYNAAVEYVGGNGGWLQVEYDGHLSGHDDVDKLCVILDPSKAPIETYEANIIVTPDFEYEEPLTINVVFEVIVGINEISDDLSIYPNPAENVLTVKGTFENLSVISVERKNLLNVIKSQTTEEITDVNVSELPAGVYFIKIKVSEKQIVIKKFVKQ
ncbi:MAG: T9SS type A sorting domain-containing protein, partial [Bacteroidales bacterium]|nr:T9SS type A sorting domain-containing protein [Bacteroidales bacterium]